MMINHYLTEYQKVAKNLAGANLAWLAKAKQQSLDYLQQHGFPTFRDEDWKYTNVTPLINREFQWSNSSEGDHKGRPYAEFNSHQIVFINGHYSASFSKIKSLPKEIKIGSLAEILNKEPDLVAHHLTRLANSNSAFTALNTSFIHDGIYLHIPKNIIIEQPIQLIFISGSEQSAFSNIRNLIIAEENAQATIIESHMSATEQDHFSNTVTEIFLYPHSQINHYKLLQENNAAFHIDTLYAQQQTNSQFNAYSFVLDGNFIRSDTHVTLSAENTSCSLEGLYIARKKQHIDHHTVIDHVTPHTKSIENYKGILTDRSRVVFNGKVIVRPGAYKTDAQQSNKNLLLSHDAEIDTKPQLEIFNDDVRCTHGAAVGQLDEDALFYLRSRGLNPADARSILIFAFVREILDRVPIKALKQHLEATITQLL